MSTQQNGGSKSESKLLQKIKSYSCPPEFGMNCTCSVKTRGRCSGGNGPRSEGAELSDSWLLSCCLLPVRSPVRPSYASPQPHFGDRDSPLWLHLESPGSFKHGSQLGPQGFWFKWGGSCPVQPGCALGAGGATCRLLPGKGIWHPSAWPRPSY